MRLVTIPKSNATIKVVVSLTRQNVLIIQVSKTNTFAQAPQRDKEGVIIMPSSELRRTESQNECER